MNPVEQALSYAFEDTSLLHKALVHASYSTDNNERLEFVGDRVLNLVVAELLFEHYPDVKEGLLAKRHAALVCAPTLAKVAQLWRVPEAIILGTGEQRSGGAQKENILADAVEAIIAALYFDAGFEAVRALIITTWQPLLDTVTLKDNKTRLQEWLQARGEPVPRYLLRGTEGASHDAIFEMQVQAGHYGAACGKGKSKQQAEQAAAGQLLEALEGKTLS